MANFMKDCSRAHRKIVQRHRNNNNGFAPKTSARADELFDNFCKYAGTNEESKLRRESLKRAGFGSGAKRK